MSADERPGGWVEGIGWVARLRDLGPYDIAANPDGRIAQARIHRSAGVTPQWGYVTVVGWADGTEPERPVLAAYDSTAGDPFAAVRTLPEWDENPPMSADDERLVHGRGDPWDCGVCNPTGLSRSDWTAAERAKQRADVAALTAPSPSTDTAGDPSAFLPDDLVATARRIGCTLAEQLADEVERLRAAQINRPAPDPNATAGETCSCYPDPRDHEKGCPLAAGGATPNPAERCENCGHGHHHHVGPGTACLSSHAQAGSCSCCGWVPSEEGTTPR